MCKHFYICLPYNVHYSGRGETSAISSQCDENKGCFQWSTSKGMLHKSHFRKKHPFQAVVSISGTQKSKIKSRKQIFGSVLASCAFGQNLYTDKLKG